MLHIADVSEFQGSINWAAYGAAIPAVIVRAHNGYRPDNRWVANRDGARQHVRLRGWYQYLVAGIDAVVQADRFVDTVGPLQSGEFVVLDLEEGAGDQTIRAMAWLVRVNTRLHTKAWDYSGESFFTHQLAPLLTDGTPDWVAAYRSTEPTIGHVLWQHTNHEGHPGIAGPCDCSVFNGTADDLERLIVGAGHPANPLPDPVSYPEDNMASQEFPAVQLDKDGNGWVELPVPVSHIESVRFNGRDPVANHGYDPENEIPEWEAEDYAGHTRLQVIGGPKGGIIGFTVWYEPA